MGTPSHTRRTVRVVVLIVVGRRKDGKPLAQVAAILRVERHRRIFAVPRNEELTTLARHHDVHTSRGRLAHDFQFLHPLDVAPAHLAVTAVRRKEHIVETAENRQFRPQDTVTEHAEHLVRRRILRHAVEVVQRRLSRPADVARRLHIVVRPVEHLLQFRPVRHRLEIHLLQRRTRHDEAVVLLAAHLLKVTVERHHVLHRRVLAGVAPNLHKLDFHLQRRVRQDADKVRLRRNLDRHEVQNRQPQRTDILSVRPRRIHHKDILAFQQFDGRQPVWQCEWHSCKYKLQSTKYKFYGAKLRLSERNTK